MNNINEIVSFLLNEEKLTASDRNKLKASEFGIPEDRAFPMHDKEHLVKAIQMFHKCDETKKFELASNIFKAAKKFNLEISVDDNVKKFYLSHHKKLNENDLGIFNSIENFEYRFDEWKQGKTRVLFICGLSGSGKTTYGRELAQETNSTLISLDGYLKPMIRDKYGKDITSSQYQQRVFDSGIEDLLKANPAGKIIFEGGQICWMNPEKLKNYSVIIVGTSFVTSTWRAILRDFSKEHWEEYSHIVPHVHTKFNLKTFFPIKNVLLSLRNTETSGN